MYADAAVIEKGASALLDQFLFATSPSLPEWSSIFCLRG
jgi:hypothetical protein